MEETFAKQRRNLLLTSILLLIVQFAGVGISSDMKVGIVALHFKDPTALNYLLLIIHLFILARYFQSKPKELKSFLELFYTKRMIELARIVVPINEQCTNDYYEINYAHQEEQREREQEEMYGERVSPNYEPRIKEILEEPRYKIKNLHNIARQIEKIDDKTFRWQFPDGYNDPVTHTVYDFSPKDIYDSYFEAIFPTLRSKHFADIHFPAFLGTISAISFTYYLVTLIITTTP